MSKKNSSILVIPDLHVPFHHPDAFDFLDAVSNRYSPDRVVCLGDEVDKHNMSFHDSDPDIPFSASGELEKAIWHLKDLYLLFPRVDVIESNHGSMVYRKGKAHGIPRHYFKTYQEILEAPKRWVWHLDLVVTASNGQDIYFHHGLSKNAMKTSQNKSMNHCCGHYHSEFAIQYWANSRQLYWAMNTGCLIDDKAMAFNYNNTTLARPILGCGVILDGIPKLIPMVLNKKGRWDKKVL